MPEDDPKCGPSQPDGWRDLAQKASSERDPKKLLHLIQELCDRLDQESATRKAQRKNPLRSDRAQRLDTTPPEA